MKNFFKTSAFVLFFFGLVPIFHSCKKAAVPTLTTANVTNITGTTASSGGTITDEGSSTVIARGVCWSTTVMPTISDNKTNDGSGVGTFTSNMSGLNALTTYYIRAYATNNVGTAYGDQLRLVTLQTNQISDIDGNIYNTVSIGTQVWMVENLTVTKYGNGDQITNITDNTQWDLLTTGARSTNVFLPDYVATYGWFYNWYAVADNRHICPTGWHVPSDDEWTTLTTYLGGESVAGGKLKETGTAHWESPNTGATNESGFTALGGEFYDSSGGWFGPRNWGVWWTSSEADANNAWNRILFFTDASITRVANRKALGISVRCIKD